MKNYVVIALYVGGKNKVFTSGDIVNESNFETSIENLEKQGFIKSLESDDDVQEITIEMGFGDTLEDVQEDTEVEPKFTTIDGKKVFYIQDCSANEIKTELTFRGVNFDNRANKTTLWGLLG